MKKVYMAILLFFTILCTGCAGSDNSGSERQEAVMTYGIPVNIYTFTDTDSMDKNAYDSFCLELNQTLAASKKDKSISTGEFDSETGMVYLSFDRNQKEKYVKSLKSQLEPGNNDIITNDLYTLESYGREYDTLKIHTRDEASWEKAKAYVYIHIDCLIQLQILSGADYETAGVIVYIDYDDGTSREKSFDQNNIY